MTALTRAQVVDLLNDWEEANPIVGDPGDGPNIFDDLVVKLDGYNEAASMLIDRQDRGDRFVVNFADGPGLRPNQMGAIPIKPVIFKFDDKRVQWWAIS
jgi:hypothetical protein